MLLEMHSGTISFVRTLFHAHQLFDYFLCSLQWRQLHVKLPNCLNDCNTVESGAYMCALATTSLIVIYAELYFCTWRHGWYVLVFAVSSAAPPLQMLTVPLLISLLRISSSSSSGLYCDAMPCALYHILLAQGGEDPIWWCLDTLEEKRAFNSQHSFREDQRMLLAAHSSYSTNSLLKARATAYGR